MTNNNQSSTIQTSHPLPIRFQSVISSLNN